MRLHSAAGYSGDLPIERYYRDTALFLHRRRQQQDPTHHHREAARALR
jgi:alkylation response protein AidB-like acyl-CoA dehydrogenase